MSITNIEVRIQTTTALFVAHSWVRCEVVVELQNLLMGRGAKNMVRAHLAVSEFPFPTQSRTFQRLSTSLPTNTVAMGRLHSNGKGISASAIPYSRTPPAWLKITPEQVVEQSAFFHEITTTDRMADNHSLQARQEGCYPLADRRGPQGLSVRQSETPAFARHF